MTWRNLLENKVAVTLIMVLIMASFGGVFAQDTVMEVVGDLIIGESLTVGEPSEEDEGIVEIYSTDIASTALYVKNSNTGATGIAMHLVTASGTGAGILSQNLGSGIAIAAQSSGVGSQELSIGIQAAGKGVGVYAIATDESGKSIEAEGDMTLDGDLDITGDLTIPTGKILISDAQSFEKMSSAPDFAADIVKVYTTLVSGDSVLWARDSTNTTTQLSSHKDPRGIDPSLQSSFADPSVAMPYSFHHTNSIVGKGAVVDMSAAIAELERLSGKQFVTVYDLPSDEIVEVEDWTERTREQLSRKEKERVLREQPEIEIPIGEAYEMAPETVLREETETKIRYTFDLDSLAVTPVQYEEKTRKAVPTGRTTRTLKPGVRFDAETGKFLKKRTIEEVTLAEQIPDPQLPEWILSRLPEE